MEDHPTDIYRADIKERLTRIETILSKELNRKIYLKQILKRVKKC